MGTPHLAYLDTNAVGGYRDKAREHIEAEARARGAGPPKPMALCDAVAAIWPNLV